MRNLLFCIIPLMISGSSLFSQISIGFTIGNNFSTIRQKVDYSANPAFIKPDQKDYRFISGLIIGMPVEIKLSGKIGLFTEIIYYQKGGRIVETFKSSPDSYFTVDGKTRFNYLELPLQCKFYFVRKAVNAFILIGPGFGYAVNARSQFDMDTYNVNEPVQHQSFDMKIKSEDLKHVGMNRFDISLSLGGGLCRKVWIGDAFFNITYSYGLTDMMNSEIEANKGVDEYNRGLNTTFGYLIRLTK